LTFDALLNCLSGIESADGVFKVATTNNIGELDSALGVPSVGEGQSTISTRPGRFDRALELPALDDSGRRKIAARILGDCPWCIGDIVAAGTGDTGAQFVERCSQAALAEHWQTAPASTSDEAIDSALKLHYCPVENMSHVA
jgi:SpoVK/Ycf46/Vps4 family AAA+-type ATPase